MKRSGQLRRSDSLRRRRRKKTRTDAEAGLSRQWHDDVLARTDHPILRTKGGDESMPQAHHIIKQQTLRRRARDLDLPESLLLWDLRVGMKVSVRRHGRHHSCHEPILRSELPVQVFEFAADYGLSAWLDRHYAVETVRPV